MRCDRADPQRVEGAHGSHRDTRGLHLMLTGSIGERIGAAHSAVTVEDHEIASGEPVERCGHVAGRERNRGSDLHRRRRVALGDIGPEDGTPHLVLGAVDAMPPAADKCREQRCQGRMGAWRGDRSPVRDDGAVGECNRRFRGSVSGGGKRHGLSSAAAGRALALDLDRRTRNVAIGTKDAAIALLGLEDRAAAPAVIEKLACVGRHRLGRLMSAVRTGQGRVQLRNDVRHSYNPPRAVPRRPIGRRE